MNKGELVEEISSQTGETKAAVEKVVNTLMENIAKVIKKDKTVVLFGFGTFKKVHRKARKGRNPKTGEAIKIAASSSVRFTPAKALKEKIK